MANRSKTHKHPNQPEIQTDTIKHKQTEVHTDSYTRKKDIQKKKKKNYYNAKPRSHRCLTKTLLHLYIHVLNTTLQLLKIVLKLGKPVSNNVADRHAVKRLYPRKYFMQYSCAREIVVVE